MKLLKYVNYLFILLNKQKKQLSQYHIASKTIITLFSICDNASEQFFGFFLHLNG